MLELFQCRRLCVRLNARCSRAKPFKLFDEEGLFLLINPSGSKLWRMKYRFAGKEKLLAFGSYPETPLKEARAKRDKAHAILKAGRDPGAERKAEEQKKEQEAKNIFKPVALALVEEIAQKRKWSERHKERAIRRLEINVFPDLRDRPFGEIEPPDVLSVLRKIEACGAHETAARTRVLLSQIFRFGIGNGLCKRDAAADLKGVLTPTVSENMARVELEELPQLLLDIDGCEGAPACRDRQTRLGLQLLALTFVRTGELRKSMWEHVSFKNNLWTFPAGIMKKGRTHLVPLAKQTISVLEELHEITGSGKFLFPGEGKKGIMSENTLLYALYSLGYRNRMTGHGFRGLASTILNEVKHAFYKDWIEMQLAHKDKDKTREAYNSAKWLDQRAVMLQWLADYYDELRKGRYIKPLAYASQNKPVFDQGLADAA
jgi:integrase